MNKAITRAIQEIMISIRGSEKCRVVKEQLPSMIRNEDSLKTEMYHLRYKFAMYWKLPLNIISTKSSARYYTLFYCWPVILSNHGTSFYMSLILSALLSISVLMPAYVP